MSHSGWKRAGAAVLVAVVAGLLYARALTFGLITVTDDDYNILRHHHDLWRVWTEGYMGFYLPLPYTVWTLLWKAGVGAAWYHGVNVALHALAAVAVYRIVQVFRPHLAVLGALVFAIYPFQVEAVAWVTGLRDVMAGCLGLWALSRYLDGRFRWAGILAVLACLAKPSAIVVLPMALLLRPMVGALWLAPSALVAVLSASLQSDLVPPDFAWPHRTQLALQTLGYYVTQGPSADHWVRGAPGEAGPVLLGLVVLGLCLCSRGMRLYTVALLPTLGLIAFGGQHHSTVADRYAYLAVLGVAFSFTGAVDWLIKEKSQALAVGVATVVMLLWLDASRSRIELWRNAQVLYHHEIYICDPQAFTKRPPHCEYMVKPNSAMVLSILAERAGDEKMAETYALEAKDAYEWKERQLNTVSAYR